MPDDGSHWSSGTTLRKEVAVVSHAALNAVCDVVLRAGTTSGAWTGLPDVGTDANGQVLRRLRATDLNQWAAMADRVGFCSRPVRLVGSSTTVDRAIGEVLREYSSTDEPGGVTVVRCGNRREEQCPSCSRLYAADTLQLIRAGVAGGKGVPETIVDNPLVFATLTAPSFGAVHGRGRGGSCRPRRGLSARCRHGRLSGCVQVHDSDDPQLGQPLCPVCYDYVGQVVWQWWAPELWRRFTIPIRNDHLRLSAANRRPGTGPGRGPQLSWAEDDGSTMQFRRVPARSTPVPESPAQLFPPSMPSIASAFNWSSTAKWVDPHTVTTPSVMSTAPAPGTPQLVSWTPCSGEFEL